MASIEIKRALPEDAEAIYDIIKKAWYATYVNDEIGITKDDIDAIYAESQNEKFLESLRNRISKSRLNEVELVARDMNNVVGVIRQVIHEECVELRTIYVDPEYFGKGVGTKLWNESLKFLPENEPVAVEVAAYTNAVNFYKKIGFIDTGERYTKDESVMKLSGIRMPLMKMVFAR